jgi:hypothetical protein
MGDPGLVGFMAIAGVLTLAQFSNHPVVEPIGPNMPVGRRK